MPHRFTAVIRKEEKWYVAQCIELGVVSQGKTIEKAGANLKEAVEVYLEGLADDEIPASTGEFYIYSFEVEV